MNTPATPSAPCRRALISILFLSAAILSSCGVSKFEQIPRNGFITHFQKSDHERMPFESYWDVSDNADWDERVEGKRGKSQAIHFKPVTLAYFEGLPTQGRERQAVEELRDYFQQKLTSEMQKLDAENSSFHLSTAPGKETYTVEIALLSAKGTRIERNIAATAAGIVVKGGGLLFFSRANTGYLSMGVRFYAPNGKLVAEVADFEYGQKSLPGMVLIDLKDYRHFAYQRQTIDQWVDEFKQIFTTIHEHKIRKPWFTLNPL